jgi:hypothetical protein
MDFLRKLPVNKFFSGFLVVISTPRALEKSFLVKSAPTYLQNNLKLSGL